MPSAELSRRVEQLVACPPLSEMGAHQRREFHEALLSAHSFEELPGKVAGGGCRRGGRTGRRCVSSAATR